MRVDHGSGRLRRSIAAGVAGLFPLLLGACAATAGAGLDSGPFPDAPSLLAADRAFAGGSARRGVDAWVDAWADRGRLGDLPDSAAVGRDAVRHAMGPTLERLGPRFRWEPTSSGMLWPDSLGYTVGRYWIEPEPGDAPAEPGRYLSVWIREGDAWRVALDLSIPAIDASDPAGEFAFWVGDWRVDQRIWAGSGEAFDAFPARTRVRVIADGVLAESWEGTVRFPWAGMAAPVAIRGASFRIRDPESGRWRIFWMDTLDPAFGPPFVGAFAGAEPVGEFVRARPLEDGRRLRITFRPLRDDAVHWDLAVLDGETVARTLWIMEFRRRR